MSKFSTLIFATLAAGLLSGPTFAQTTTTEPMDMSTMTCADLMKMDQDGMMTAASNVDIMMQMDAMSDADKKALDDKMATETAGMTDAEKTAHKMTAMQTDMKTKTDAMTDDQKAEQIKMTEGTMTKLETACKGNDAMLINDAAKSMN